MLLYIRILTTTFPEVWGNHFDRIGTERRRKCPRIVKLLACSICDCPYMLNSCTVPPPTLPKKWSRILIPSDFAVTQQIYRRGDLPPYFFNVGTRRLRSTMLNAQPSLTSQRTQVPSTVNTLFALRTYLVQNTVFFIEYEDRSYTYVRLRVKCVFFFGFNHSRNVSIHSTTNLKHD